MRFFLLTAGLFLLACPSSPVGGGLDGGLQDGGLPGDIAGHPPLPVGVTLRRADFATGVVCGECHSATATVNVDEKGRPIGLFEQWSATPMANAVRDPLFRAAVANEIARAPAAAEAIASVCLTCHAGMGRHAQLRAGVPTTLALAQAADEDGALARDGVSCTVCHQIQPTNFGLDSSFSGGYLLSSNRQIVGPYPAPFAMPMANRTGFTPVEGAHIQSSALCGTCHTLVTEALTPQGTGTGHHMGEQLTYLEWRRSAFSTEGGGTTPRSCQSCHMPDRRDDGAPLSAVLAHSPGGGEFRQVGPRSPFSRHTFQGANTLLPKLLREGRALLNPIASDAALIEAERLARSTLRTAAARLEVSAPEQRAGVLSFTVRVENLTGHKFPSGYPSRRAFLQLVALDAAGAVVFESGAVDGEGRLLGADGQRLTPESVGGDFHPHRDTVQRADDVIVYESVMQDGAGQPSFDLLGAEGYVKDNRLLPQGHADSTTGPQSTSPVGVTDADFGPGADVVHVAVPVSRPASRLEVRLRYQTFAPRTLDQLLLRPTPESAALKSMLKPGLLAPELVDEVLLSL